MVSEDKEILDRFATIVADTLQIDKDRVTEDAYLDELGAESLDFVEIGFETDDEFRITLPEKDILSTAREVFGEDMLVKDDLLTPDAKKFIEKRMPELDPACLEGDVSVAQITREFGRVGSWIRLIRGLMEYTPDKCTECGADWKKPVAGQLKCSSCNATYDILDGQDISRKWVEEYYNAEYESAKAS